jgi:redox-sensing transcriptional repressor
MPSDRPRRRIPEATVARLPVYLRILAEQADEQVDSISSDRLAELAGVNAAKVRKDLSYLGSYGTRGVGLRGRSTSCTRSAASSASPTTGRSSSSAPATSARPSPATAASASGASRWPASSTSTRQGRHGARRGARAPHRRAAADRADQAGQHRRVATPSASPPRTRPTAWWRAGVTSILNFAPVVLSVPRARSRCARSISRSSCRSSAITSNAAPAPSAAVPVARRPADGQRVRFDPYVASWSSVSTTARHRSRCSSASLSSGPSSRRRSPDWCRCSQRPRGRGAQHLQPHRGVRRRRALPRRLRRHPRLLLRARRPAPDELHPHLYSQHDDAAVSHLFEVAAGLDSAVLGESEILGQVRHAWEVAQAEGGRARRSTCSSATRSRPASGLAPRPPSAGTPRRSAARRSRWPPSASAAWSASGCSCSAPARWARASPRAGQGRRHRHHRHQPHARAWRGPGRAGARHAPCRTAELSARWRRPTCSSPAAVPARGRRRRCRTRLAAASPPRCSWSTSPCRATSTPRSPASRTSPCSISRTCATGPLVASSSGRTRPSTSGRSCRTRSSGSSSSTRPARRRRSWP